ARLTVLLAVLAGLPVLTRRRVRGGVVLGRLLAVLLIGRRILLRRVRRRLGGLLVLRILLRRVGGRLPRRRLLASRGLRLLRSRGRLPSLISGLIGRRLVCALPRLLTRPRLRRVRSLRSAHFSPWSSAADVPALLSAWLYGLLGTPYRCRSV
ncbi:MAG: hypothetical protein Q7U75_09700, partial [Desulfobacterales bacterium]|nr:hypothetical protein [Desulfobacterales bacterium]